MPIAAPPCSYRPSWRSGLAALLAACAMGSAQATTPQAEVLRARHASLSAQLADNAFRRPLHLVSAEKGDTVQGEVYAVVEHDFATVRSALQSRQPWCDILILHPNVKQCRAAPATRRLAVSVGRKLSQEASDAHLIGFDHRVTAAEADYLQVRMDAPAGPMGTRDYRLVLEATPVDARRSFLHLSYSYGYGFAARMAMLAYLNTAGSGKVGFTVVSHRADGSPVLTGDVRGAVERNTMRYYLAIDTYLDSLSAPGDEQVERRLQNWFAATERYPRQLREMNREEYLSVKRLEIQRQRADVRAAGPLTSALR
jgi:hypothetical protein